MARRFFTVETVFEIRGRGLVLAPGFVPEVQERFCVGDPITLMKKDGSTVASRIGGFELFNPPNPRPELVIVLEGMTRTEVLVGTEVWSVDA